MASYSKISFADVSEKLRLEPTQNVGYILLKAVRDGVIKGRIDPSQKVLLLEETTNLYATSDPQNAFCSRISYLNSLSSLATKVLFHLSFFPPLLLFLLVSSLPLRVPEILRQEGQEPIHHRGNPQNVQHGLLAWAILIELVISNSLNPFENR